MRILVMEGGGLAGWNRGGKSSSHRALLVVPNQLGARDHKFLDSSQLYRYWRNISRPQSY